MMLVRDLLQKNVLLVCRTRSVLRRYSVLPPSIPKSQSSLPEDDDPASLSSFIFENLHQTSSRPALVNREEELSFMEVSQAQSSETELDLHSV